MSNQQTNGDQQQRQTVSVSVGQQLRALRKAAGLRQEDVAHKAGIDRTTVIRAEQGDPITSETLIRFMQALRPPNSELLQGLNQEDGNPYNRCCAYVRALPVDAVEALLDHLFREWHPRHFGQPQSR